MPAPSTRHAIQQLITLAGAPLNTGAPVVTGIPVVGQLLSTTDGTWDTGSVTFTYQWQRDGNAIGGATSSTYTSVTADLGHTVTALVTATSTVGLGASIPAVSNGIAIVGEMAGADVQVWTAAAGGLGGSPDEAVPSPMAVFDSVTNNEAVAGDTEYRAVYLLNTHPTRSLTSAKIWVAVQTSSTTTDVALGVAVQAAGTDVVAIPNESTPPASVSFTAPVDEAGGLSMGTIGPGQARGIWLKWTILAGTDDTDSDAWTLGWSGTPA